MNGTNNGRTEAIVPCLFFPRLHLSLGSRPPFNKGSEASFNHIFLLCIKWCVSQVTLDAPKMIPWLRDSLDIYSNTIINIYTIISPECNNITCAHGRHGNSSERGRLGRLQVEAHADGGGPV